MTKTQREKAMRLWVCGTPMKIMAHALGMTVKELEYETNYRRALYPYRHRMKQEGGNGNDGTGRP